MKKYFYLFSILLICSKFSSAQDQQRQLKINSIFGKMEHQGIDTKKPLLYGYFFFDEDKSKLEKLKDELLKDNYNLVKLEMTGRQEYILQVEKVEIHSRSSLMDRENQLDRLSRKFQVKTYDGWDVGNVDSLKPSIEIKGFNESTLPTSQPSYVLT